MNYIINVDKGQDKEDVGFRILQCSLFLPALDMKVPSVQLHRVVHENIKLFKNDKDEKTQSQEPLYIFRSLFHSKRVLSGFALIPHLKVYGRMKDLPSDLLVPESMKIKQEMQKQIVSVSSVLEFFGEFLLSKNYLIIALKMATDGHEKNIDFEDFSYKSFPRIVHIFFHLGNTELNFRNAKNARIYYERALEIFLAQYGPSHELVGRCYINLACVGYLNPEEFNDAILYSELAIKISDKFKCIYYINLGWQQYLQGKLLKPDEYFLRVTEILMKMKEDKNSTDLSYVNLFAALLQRLGIIYSELGNYDVSKRFFQSSIDFYLTVHGQNHLGLADSYYNMCYLHRILNELPEAEKCCRQAREIYSKQLEPSHQRVIMVSRQLIQISKNK